MAGFQFKINGEVIEKGDGPREDSGTFQVEIYVKGNRKGGGGPQGGIWLGGEEEDAPREEFGRFLIAIVCESNRKVG